MERKILFLGLLLAASLSSAQSPAILEDSTTQAIDAQVWRPFVKAFNAHDVDDYLAVHARGVVRWPLGWEGPEIGDSVHVGTRRGWSTPRSRSLQRSIDLYFTHRTHTKAFAYDIGYYQVRITPENGEVTTHEGHFTTILGREDGRWKIFLDADNGDGVKPDDLNKGVRLMP
jgi:hypothetical protein